MPRRHHWPYLYLWRRGSAPAPLCKHHWWLAGWAFGTYAITRPNSPGADVMPTRHA